MSSSSPSWILYVLLCVTSTTVLAVPMYRPLNPPSYPLAARNPYLSAWLPGSQVASLPSSQAQFWTGKNLTWSVLVRVDGTTYNLFGVPLPEHGTESGIVTSAEYTASHSIFTISAGSVEFQLDFFSPVWPQDKVRQSMPFSYLTVTGEPINGLAKPKVQIYSDIDDLWTGQDTAISASEKSVWNYTTSGTTGIYQIDPVGTIEYSENNDMALWGSAIYATRPSGNNSSILTAQSGALASVRGQFVLNGTLNGDQTSWIAGGVVGFAHDMGSISTKNAVTFAVGYVRDNDVNYFGTGRVGYYKSVFPGTEAAVNGFLSDYGSASNDSHAMDWIVKHKATTAGGDQYADIVTLSTRQTMAAMDITLPQSLDIYDEMAFLKEISSDGNVNTMDVIFPAFPQLYVLEPDYIRLLVEPVLRYLKSGTYPNPWVVHDLGSAYPNITGHDDGQDEKMPIEETGNLLILAYAYTKVSGNTTWAKQYTPLLQTYADYLVSNGLYPAMQLSTDDGAGEAANQTNLAIKAAVSLTAFGSLSGQKNYTDIGVAFAASIYEDGLGTDSEKTHFTLEYGDYASWTTAFNLYPDYLLKLNTFNSSAYAMQSSFYSTVRGVAGIPLDSRVNWTKTDWNLWVATTSSNTTRDMIMNDVRAYLSNGMNSVPFSDRYIVSPPGTPGTSDQYKARPVVGGEWSLMAVEGTFRDSWGEGKYRIGSRFSNAEF